MGFRFKVVGYISVSAIASVSIGQHYLFSGSGGRGGGGITAKWCLYKKLGTPLLLQTKFTAKRDLRI